MRLSLDAGVCQTSLAGWGRVPPPFSPNSSTCPLARFARPPIPAPFSSPSAVCNLSLPVEQDPGHFWRHSALRAPHAQSRTRTSYLTTFEIWVSALEQRFASRLSYVSWGPVVSTVLISAPISLLCEITSNVAQPQA